MTIPKFLATNFDFIVKEQFHFVLECDRNPAGCLLIVCPIGCDLLEIDLDYLSCLYGLVFDVKLRQVVNPA